MTRTLALTRSFVVITAVLAMMTIALVSLGMRGAPLFAAATPELEIAPLTSGSWAKAAEGTWIVSGLQPGTQESGGVRLRVLNPTGNEIIVLSVDSQGAPGPLLAQTRIASMTMDSIDLLPLWSHCGGSDLTLTDVMSCPNPPDLPAPSSSSSAFMMSFALTEDASNAVQGQSTGVLSFTFALHGESTDGPKHEPERPMDESSTAEPPVGVPPATGSTPPPSAAPDSPPVERPMDELDGTDSPLPGVAVPGAGPSTGAPAPGSTGHGMLAAATELMTVPAASLAAVLAATLLVLLVARRRRKRDEAG